VLFDVYDRDGGAVAQLMEELRAAGRFSVSQGALARLRELFVSGSASEAETRATIAATLARSGEILCPHSAVAVKVAQEHLGPTPMISLATAHPAKFPAAVKEACGQEVALPPRLHDLFARPERVTEVANDLTALETLIRERIQK